MTKAFVIGNGTSRRGVNLHALKKHGLTFGCNYLYREFVPDYLIALDVGIKEELKGKMLGLRHYVTREQVNIAYWFVCDGHPVERMSKLNGGLNNNSGIVAAAWASEIMLIDTVYLIGMDFFRPVPNEDNDITGGNYPGGPSLTKCWNRLIENNPQTRFARVGPIAEYDREYYNTLTQKLELISYEHFFKSEIGCATV